MQTMGEHLIKHYPVVQDNQVIEAWHRPAKAEVCNPFQCSFMYITLYRTVQLMLSVARLAAAAAVEKHNGALASGHWAGQGRAGAKIHHRGGAVRTR